MIRARANGAVPISGGDGAEANAVDVVLSRAECPIVVLRIAEHNVRLVVVVPTHEATKRGVGCRIPQSSLVSIREQLDDRRIERIEALL